MEKEVLLVYVLKRLRKAQPTPLGQKRDRSLEMSFTSETSGEATDKQSYLS